MRLPQDSEAFRSFLLSIMERDGAKQIQRMNQLLQNSIHVPQYHSRP